MMAVIELRVELEPLVTIVIVNLLDSVVLDLKLAPPSFGLQLWVWAEAWPIESMILRVLPLRS